MHELSIALSLVDLACEEAERLGNPRVEALYLRLGPLAGVVRDALEFSFGLATAGTAIDGARLEIEETSVVARCPACEADRPIPNPQHLRCPVCDEPVLEIVSGRELQLAALEVADEQPTDCRGPQERPQEER